MSIKPILFNTEMVRAILDGRKTCTRRILKHDVETILNSPYHKAHPEVEDKQIISKLCQPPYQPGDILYVRETWMDYAGRTMYRADCDKYRLESLKLAKFSWKPSIHMPKEAARIWLKVTDVRVERLHEISEDGAKAEGTIDNRGFIHSPDNEYDRIHTAREHFIEIWNSTIKKANLDKYGWDVNPWVWVIEFERCEKPAESPYAWNDAIDKLTKGV